MKTPLFCILLFFLNYNLTFAQSKNEPLIYDILENIGLADNDNKAIEFVIINVQDGSINELSDDFYNDLREELKEQTKDSLWGKMIHLIEDNFSNGELKKLSKQLKEDKESKLVDRFTKIIKTNAKEIVDNWLDNLLKLGNEKVKKANLFISNKGLEHCALFHEGKFKYNLPDGTEVELIRSKNKQLEINGQDTVVMSIEWLTECEYKMKLISCTQKGVFEAQKDVVIIYKICGIIDKTAMINMADEKGSLPFNTKLIKIE